MIHAFTAIDDVNKNIPPTGNDDDVSAAAGDVQYFATIVEDDINVSVTVQDF